MLFHSATSHADRKQPSPGDYGPRLPTSNRRARKLSFECSFVAHEQTPAKCKSRLNNNTTTVKWPFVQDYPGEPVPEEMPSSGFYGAGEDADTLTIITNASTTDTTWPS